ncbi:MAG: hypothetical protein AAF958_00900 [Planctomycetota bacterium]
MHLKSNELRVQQYIRDDGVTSAAIKLIHRHSDSVVVCDDSPVPRQNLHRAIERLMQQINPNRAVVTTPRYYPFDEVVVRLPDSFQPGEVAAIEFNYQTRRWTYQVTCNMPSASGTYDAADLTLREG